MDIVLHLGAHRTAGATLRAVLRRDMPPGVVLWGPEVTQPDLLHGFLSVRPAVRQRAAGRLAMRIDGLRKHGVETLVISDAALLGPGKEALYPNAGLVMASLRDGAGQPLRIGLAVRGGVNAETRRWQHVIADIAQASPRSDLIIWPSERFAGRPHLPLAALLGQARFAVSGPVPWLRKSSARPSTAPSANRGYAADIAWLRSGADGLATWLEPECTQHIIDHTGGPRRVAR